MLRATTVTILAVLICFCTTSVVCAQMTMTVVPPAKSQSEEWAGARTSGARSQKMVLRLSEPEAKSATIDLPDFGALGIPASGFMLSHGHIHFELVGDSETAVFDGIFEPNKIRGHWNEGAHSGDFRSRMGTYGFPERC
jgi:hypothetical protein